MSAGEGDDVNSGVAKEGSALASHTSEPSPAPSAKRGVLLHNSSNNRKAFFKSGILHPGCTMRVSKKAAKQVQGITWIEVVEDD